MTLYMAQFAYTREAWAQFTKNPEDRTAVVKELAEKLGCRMEGLYYSFGDYDGFLIVDAPNEAAIASFMLASIAPGHLRATKVTTLLRSDVVVEAMKKAGMATFRGPKR